MEDDEIESVLSILENIGGFDMRSIWTRVRGSGCVKADTVKSQEAGSGEGATPSIAKDASPPVKEQVAASCDKSEKDSQGHASVEQGAIQEQRATDDVESSENAQPEQVQVEEIKSNVTPIDIDVAPGQIVSQEVLVEVNANKTDNVVQKNEGETKTEQPPVAKASATDSIQKAEVQPNDSQGDWQHREQQLLKIIEQLEEVKVERSEDGLKLELKIREEEIELLKARVKSLETELQATLSKPGGKNQEIIDKIKQQHEELLSKARGMIFDKTKIVKNQELQIEALTTQIQSLKDINLITKDLLEIRNSEVKAMEERLQVMEARFKTEKERYDLVLKRAQTSTNINDDLRKEYETQLAIFKELREKYELRVQALVAENNRLKESLQGGGSG